MKTLEISYNNAIDQLYLVIGNILREKLGEKIIISFKTGKSVSGILKQVNSDSFAISYGEDGGLNRWFKFCHMEIFPFKERNIISMNAGNEFIILKTYENS